jgi:hypothetical protein
MEFIDRSLEKIDEIVVAIVEPRPLSGTELKLPPQTKLAREDTFES